jgi:hypothetical protein
MFAIHDAPDPRPGRDRRLLQTARADGRAAHLRAGLKRTSVASVGPVVSQELKSYGLNTDIHPVQRHLDEAADYLNRIASVHLVRRAQDSSWREDKRRVSNGNR